MSKEEKAVGGNERIIALLNRIMEYELAGVVRYTHYSLMVFGYNRLPIISWLSGKAGEMITHIGGHPSLGIGPLLETHKHDIGDILRESLEHEAAALQLYRELFKEVEGKSVMLEEYARNMIYTEEQHQGEVNKMLRKPGDVSV